jgi:hypothetical protein
VENCLYLGCARKSESAALAHLTPQSATTARNPQATQSNKTPPAAVV